MIIVVYLGTGSSSLVPVLFQVRLFCGDSDSSVFNAGQFGGTNMHKRIDREVFS